MSTKEQLETCMGNGRNEERKEHLKEDVEKFVEVLETYFNKEKIWEYKFQYRIKEESFGFIDNPLELAYKKLLDKWLLKKNLLIQEISERLKKDSIDYTDEAGFIRGLRRVSFSVQ